MGLLYYTGEREKEKNTRTSHLFLPFSERGRASFQGEKLGMYEAK